MLQRVRIEVTAASADEAVAELNRFERALQLEMGIPSPEGHLVLAGGNPSRTVTDEVIEYDPKNTAVRVVTEDMADWVKGWKARRVVVYSDIGPPPGDFTPGDHPGPADGPRTMTVNIHGGGRDGGLEAARRFGEQLAERSRPTSED